jgi:transcriptional regulator with XRE-family HTH domain
MLMHDQLKQARERAGLSQAKLAALTGLSRNQIVRAEAGENITIDTLRRILVHLPIDEVTLLERVRVKVDYLNPAEKMFFGLGEILSHLVQATLSTMSLAMVAKDEMFMARDAEGREIDEKEQADDARLVALLQRMESALVMMDVLRGVVYKSGAQGGDPGEEGSGPSK